MVDESQIREALQAVVDPELHRSLVELGMVKEIETSGGTVRISIDLTTPACPLKSQIEADVRREVMKLPDVEEVVVQFRAMSAEEKRKLLGDKEDGPTPAQQLSHVEQVVAVMSGKGGVGKSSVTGLLAVALARQGYRVGVLDGDITGPSIPKMFGITARPGGNEFSIFPVSSRLGIRVMSINLILPQDDAPVVWRGPLIGGAIKQFWTDVLWGDLDYLLVDLPPGTGDAPLTAFQSLPVSGAVVVSSPQDLAGMIVRKAVKMAESMGVPILGVVENMSYFVCPDTGKQHEIFGPSRGDEMAKAASAPLLARMPLDPELARHCDEGRIETYASKSANDLSEAFLEAAASRGKVFIN